MELWRDIPGYEGIYQASNLGNIRTCEGKTTYSKLHGVHHWKQRVLKQRHSKRKGGGMDSRVNLWKDGKPQTWLVSRLVGLAWCPGHDAGMTINHINGNPLDNRAENLEWISRADNIRHGFVTGLNSCAVKTVLVDTRNGNKTEFYSKSEAARFLGRNEGYINNCTRNGRRPTSITGIIYELA